VLDTWACGLYASKIIGKWRFAGAAMCPVAIRRPTAAEPDDPPASERAGTVNHISLRGLP